MLVLSLWQPWSSLCAHRHKLIETRSWAAPRSAIGQRIGIAATASIKTEQSVAYMARDFQRYYQHAGLPELADLPRGCLLAIGRLYACVPMTDGFIDSLSDQERAFGWYQPGRYAWMLDDMVPLSVPMPVRGRQGLWSLPDEQIQAHLEDAAGQARQADLRRDLHAPGRAADLSGLASHP